MKLEYLFDWESEYQGEGTTVSVDGGFRMWGGGRGRVTGERLGGEFWWCNHAHRNVAGVWHPDLHGFIRTEDGADILFDAEGYSVPDATDATRALTCAMRFETADERYAWLNEAIVMLEGSFTPSQGHSVTKGYLAVPSGGA